MISHWSRAHDHFVPEYVCITSCMMIGVRVSTSYSICWIDGALVQSSSFSGFFVFKYSWFLQNIRLYILFLISIMLVLYYCTKMVLALDYKCLKVIRFTFFFLFCTFEKRYLMETVFVLFVYLFIYLDDGGYPR